MRWSGHSRENRLAPSSNPSGRRSACRVEIALASLPRLFAGFKSNPGSQPGLKHTHGGRDGRCAACLPPAITRNIEIFVCHVEHRPNHRHVCLSAMWRALPHGAKKDRNLHNRPIRLHKPMQNAWSMPGPEITITRTGLGSGGRHSNFVDGQIVRSGEVLPSMRSVFECSSQTAAAAIRRVRKTQRRSPDPPALPRECRRRQDDFSARIVWIDRKACDEPGSSSGSGAV